MAGAMCDAAVRRHAKETVQCLGLADHEGWHFGMAEGIEGFYSWPGPAALLEVQHRLRSWGPRVSTEVSTERV